MNNPDLDKLIEYLYVNGQLDENYGLKEAQDTEEDENEDEEENNYRRHR